MHKILLAVAAIAAFGLTACGGEDPDKVTVTVNGLDNDEPMAPDCSKVWVAGKTLAADYDGCMNEDTLEVAASFNCKKGPNLFQYADDFWAFGGQEIHEEAGGVASADAYGTALTACNG